MNNMEAGREMDALIDKLIKEDEPPGFWLWSTDIAAAWRLEERIAELGLIDEYCVYLNAIANTHWDEGKRQPQQWQLIHATPEDRCRAASMAVENE